MLERLKAAGLGSIPGGGAEILVDRVRKEITRGKVLTDDWLNVMRVWHELGGVSSVTMMFGHVETLAERIEHLERVRQLQDETHGFTAFICWTFQPEHTDMAHIPPAGSFDYLKTQAVARLYLDNIPNIQSSWVTQGLKIGQLALLFGANDMGSLMIEENVVAEAGTVHFLTLDQIRSCHRRAGLSRRGSATCAISSSIWPTSSGPSPPTASSRRCRWCNYCRVHKRTRNAPLYGKNVRMVHFAALMHPTRYFPLPVSDPLGRGTVACVACVVQSPASPGSDSGVLPTSGAIRLAACTISTCAGCRIKCVTTSFSSSLGLPLSSVVFLQVVIDRIVARLAVSQTLSVSRM